MIFSEFQRQASRLASNNFGVSEHLALARSLSDWRGEPPLYFRKIKAAFLSTFTVKGLPEIFKARGLFHNLWVETYLAPYDQIAQEILNTQSGLHSFKPDIIYLLTEPADKIESELEKLVEEWRRASTARVVVCKNISDNGASFFDFIHWLQKSDNIQHWYTKYKDLGDLRLAPDAFPALADQLLAFSVAAAGVTRKCLVLDLDNTLWEGIVGEDGAEKVKPNTELQKHALALYDRGVILAINSKNNEADALEALKNHPQMLLRPNHFAAWRINWNNKDTNMHEIAEELNIGLDSLAFVDDDPMQQELIRTTLPEVAVVPIAGLKNFSGFHSFNLTEEDKKRGQMYAEERGRKTLQAQTTDINTFLRQLELNIAIKSVEEATVPRVSQLTQKTNQFNLTTRRYSEDDIRQLMKSGWKIWTVQVQDRFGDYGLTGVCMVELQNREWRLDNVLLSCRVLGRGVERALMAYVIEQAMKHGADKVIGEYMPTAKNAPCANYLAETNFNLVAENNGVCRYEYQTTEPLAHPDFIKISVC